MLSRRRRPSAASTAIPRRSSSSRFGDVGRGTASHRAHGRGDRPPLCVGRRAAGGRSGADPRTATRRAGSRGVGSWQPRAVRSTGNHRHAACDAPRDRGVEPDIVLRDPCEYASAVIAHRSDIATALIGIGLADVEWGSIDVAAPALEDHRPGLTEDLSARRASQQCRGPFVTNGAAGAKTQSQPDVGLFDSFSLARRLSARSDARNRSDSGCSISAVCGSLKVRAGSVDEPPWRPFNRNKQDRARARCTRLSCWRCSMRSPSP